jgi:hypothetical protein
MYAWAEVARVLLPTTGLGYVTWFALLGGVIALLRAAGRGRCGWEALGVVLVGLTPVVWMPLLDYYHPQDILAMGFILAGVACALRQHWVGAGVLLGLAVTSQQFAVLALVPLFVVVPACGRWRVFASAALSWLVVSIPIVAASSGRALGSVIFGTGDAYTFGGTVLWETGLRGHALTFFSRIVPIILAATLGWVCHRRKGDRMLQPVPLVALLAVTLSLRLAFEQGLFGYKFLALSVMLIMLAVVRGRVPGYLIGWLVLVTLAFNPIPWGLGVNARWWGAYAASGLETLCIVVALAIVVVEAWNRRVRWYLVVGLLLAVGAFGHWPPVRDSLRAALPLWFWQVVLVGTGIVIAAAPLISFLRTEEQALPAESLSH